MDQNLTAIAGPSVAEIDRVAGMADPIIRNLQITQSYHELSATLAERTGLCANWCAFATWASKQAGQTIRREDLARTLQAALDQEPEVEQAVMKIVAVAQRLGTKHAAEKIKRLTSATLTRTAIDRVSDNVGKGNKKVFEEIGREFARFNSTCLQDLAFDANKIQSFCQELRPGLPPDGQQYLRQALTRYYQALFVADAKKRAELLLLANLEIGFHEQTRLQPEIAAALNAALVDASEFRNHLIETIFPDRGVFGRLRFFAMRLFGKLTHFDAAIDSLVNIARRPIRFVITEHLMTLTFPPNVRLRLGHDLTAAFPDSLKQIENADLLALLKQIDPTPDSLRDTGAVDWADLLDRLHFIVDLFRCYHESANLLEAPFSADQVMALKAGTVPAGQL